VSGPAELFAVRYGTYVTSRSKFFYDFDSFGEADAEMVMDYFFYVVRVAGETVLIDCGFDPEVARRRGRTPLVGALEGLAELGIARDDVDRIVVTHFHYDHVGNLRLFPRAALLSQAEEPRFWTSRVGQRERFASVTEPGELVLLAEAASSDRLELASGRAEILPGLSIELVGGHTPGQSIVHVDTAGGEVILASDALHCYEEMESDRPFAVFVDLEATYGAFDRLRELEASGATIIAGHDPSVTERYRQERGPVDAVVLRLG